MSKIFRGKKIRGLVQTSQWGVGVRYGSPHPTQEPHGRPATAHCHKNAYSMWLSEGGVR